MSELYFYSRCRWTSLILLIASPVISLGCVCCGVIIKLNAIHLLVIVNPDQLVSTPGGSAEFLCAVLPNGDGVVDVQWLLNGTLLDDPSQVDATVQYLGLGLGELKLANLSSNLNVTRVDCRAIYIDGGEKDSVDSALLLLQGTLDDLHIHTVMTVL